MTGAGNYLDRKRRSLDEVLRTRIEPGDRVRHEVHGEAVVVDVLRPQGTARIEFPSGGGIWVRLDQLVKLDPAKSRDPQPEGDGR